MVKKIENTKGKKDCISIRLLWLLVDEVGILWVFILGWNKTAHDLLLFLSELEGEMRWITVERDIRDITQLPYWTLISEG